MSSAQPPKYFWLVCLGVLGALLLGFWWRTEFTSSPQVRPPTAAARVAQDAEQTGVPSVPVASGSAVATHRLWSGVPEIQGQKLAVDSTAYVAALMRGEPRSGRVATYNRGGLDRIDALGRGSVIALPLPDGEAIGTVNLLMRDANDITRIAGGLGDGGGSFSFSLANGELAGRILLPRERLAYEVRAPVGGRVVLREIPLAEVRCDPLPPEREGPQPLAPEGPMPAPPLLSSRPTAPAVLYLDFDGETVTDPDWNNGNTIIAAASPLTNTQITEVWNRVKEDYWPFNIDVTTDLNRYLAAPVGRRMRCIITPTSSWFGSAGGVAYRSSFSQAGTLGFSTTVPCWVFNSSVSGIAEAVAHEFGHTFGLRHDGDLNQPVGSSAREYYGGHGSGAVSWGPIMGAPYTRSLAQWSKGEYSGANNMEDDVGVIASSTNGFGFAADEGGNTRATAPALTFSAGAINQVGLISSASDLDFYTFSVSAATQVNVIASPALISPNLDIGLELQDAAGVAIAAANPDLALNAELSAFVAAGTYFVKVQGAGRGNVLADGYSNYGNLGAYSLTGSFGAGVAPTITAQPTGLSVLVGGSATLTVAASGSAPLTFQWRKNGVNLQNGGAVAGATNSSLVLSDVTLADAGNYSVVVTNGLGSVASASVAVVITIPPPPVITTQPSSFASFGDSANLTVQATGEGALRYQWFRNAAPIAGATSAALWIPTIGLAELGNYHVVVSNGGGSVSSQTVALTFARYSQPPESFWLDAQESGGVAYFLFASPARILRYDLATESWLPVVNLAQTPTHFAVANDAVYVAFGFRIARFDRSVANESTVATMPSTIRGLVVAGDHLVAVTMDPSWSTGSLMTSFRRSTGQKIAESSAGYYGRGFSYSGEAGRIFWRSTAVSPSDIMTVAIDSAGGFSSGFDSPYHGAYPDAARTIVFANGSLVTDDSGVVYRAGDLRYAGSFAGRVDDLAPLPGGDGHVLRGAIISAYDGKLRRTADVQLTRYAFRLWRSATALIAFTHPATLGGTPQLEKVTAGQWRPLLPAPPLEAMGRSITPTRMVLDENGVLYVSSAKDRQVFRWSTTARRYLTPIPLFDGAKFLAYSTENRALYTDDGANTVRRIALDAGSLFETPFLAAPQALTGLQTAGRTVFFTDPSGAWYTATPAGDLVSTVKWNYVSREFTWNPATGRMFFFRDNMSPNALHFESIDADGKIAGKGETPYHSGEWVAPPIRVSPDGSLILLGSGRVFDGSQLTLLSNLGMTILDAAWEGGVIYTLSATTGGTRVDAFSATTFESTRNASFTGTPLRLFSLGAGRLLLVTEVGGYLVYRVLTASTLAVVSEDHTNSAPAAPAPQFILHPFAQTTVPGGGAVLSVMVFGGEPISYQWRRDGVALSNGPKIAGANTATLVLSNVQAADLGSFDVVATSSTGTVTSSAVAVTFAAMPAITVAPSAASVIAGDTVNLSVTATGTAPMSFQWKRNGVVVLDSVTVSGALTSTLTLKDVPASAAGSYTVTIANNAGAMTSSAAVVTIQVPVPPSITAQPQSATALRGQSVAFGVTVSGTAPVAYQWNRSGADIAGATNSTLSLTNVQTSHAGTYRVTVTNRAGSVFSTGAALVVLVPPSITAAPAPQTVLAQTAAQFSVVAEGSPLTYRWQRRLAAGADWTDVPSGAPYSGNSTAQLTIAATTLAMNGEQFRCVVSNDLGTITSAAAALTVAAPSAAVAVFAAGGHGKILRADGSIWAAGANSRGQLGDGTTVNRSRLVHVADAIGAAGLGTYHSMLVRNDGALLAMGANNGRLGDGTTTDRLAPVVVAAGAVSVDGGGEHSAFLKTDGTLWTMGGNLYGELGDGTQSMRLSPVQVAAGVARVTTGDSTTFYVKTDGTLWGMGTNDWGQLGSGEANTIRRTLPIQSATNVAAVAAGFGHTLFLKTDGTVWAMGNNLSGQLGDGTLTNRSVPINVASAATAIAAGASHSLLIKPDRSLWAMGYNNYGQLGDGTTLNRWTPVQVASEVVAVAAGDFFTLFVKSDGSVWGMGDNLWGQLADGTTLQRNSPVQFLPGLPPTLIRHPVSQSVTAGQTITLTVAAGGLAPVTYQWKKDGNTLAGATSAQLTLSNIQSGDAGRYDVVVTSAAGATTSSPATVTVMNPVLHPAISVQPTPQSQAIAGATVTLGVTATGSGPLMYQWSKNGTAIAGATSATLEITQAQPANAGSYTLTVSNAAGSTTSTPAIVHVFPAIPCAAHAVVSGGYRAGGTLIVRNTIAYASDVTAVAWQLLLPAGWAVVSSTGNAGTPPAAGTTSLAEWRWTSPPPSPLIFEYTLAAPVAQTGDIQLTARVLVERGSATPAELLAEPEPLVASPGTYHAADTNFDSQISLVELTRVIELYNTRNGSVRTGSYAVAGGVTEDSFIPEPARASTASATLARHHSADHSPRDGKLNLGELTRVIQLYNYRAGTVRTGEYRMQSGTEDGFAPGP